MKGQSKYNITKLFKLAFHAVTAFSIVPLRLATYFGFLTSLISLIIGLYIVYRKVFPWHSTIRVCINYCVDFLYWWNSVANARYFRGILRQDVSGSPKATAIHSQKVNPIMNGLITELSWDSAFFGRKIGELRIDNAQIECRRRIFGTSQRQCFSVPAL